FFFTMSSLFLLLGPKKSQKSPPPRQFSYESDTDTSTSGEMVAVEASRNSHKQANGVPIVKLSSKEIARDQSLSSKISGRGSSADYSSTSEKDDTILSIDGFAAK